jgi:hypothetical protein
MVNNEGQSMAGDVLELSEEEAAHEEAEYQSLLIWQERIEGLAVQFRGRNPDELIALAIEAHAKHLEAEQPCKELQRRQHATDDINEKLRLHAQVVSMLDFTWRDPL